MYPHLPLSGVALDADRLPPAEGAWLVWRRAAWLDHPEDAALVAALADDPSTLAVCLTQPVAWCRRLVLDREAVARVPESGLRRAVAHVERHGLLPSLGGGWMREDGTPVRGPTRPTCVVPRGTPAAWWVSRVLVWSLRLWWVGSEDGRHLVHVALDGEGGA